MYKQQLQLCFQCLNHEQTEFTSVRVQQVKTKPNEELQKRGLLQSSGEVYVLKSFLDELESQNLKDYFAKWLQNDIKYGLNMRDSNLLLNLANVKIEQRAQFIQKIVLLHRKLKLKNIVLFHAVKVLDRYLLGETYQTTIKGHLLPITCLIISHKHYNMRRIKIPKWLQILELREEQYKVNQIIENEGRVLEVLGFNIEFPISFQIASFLSKVVKLSEKAHMFMRYLLQLSFFLEPFQFMEKCNPFLVGVSCVHLSCFFLQPEKWKNDLLQPFNISTEALQQYCGQLFNVIVNAQNQPVFAVIYNKFKKKCYKNVAQIRFQKHQTSQQETRQKFSIGTPETCCDDQSNEMSQISFNHKSQEFEYIFRDESNISKNRLRKGTQDQIIINQTSPKYDENIL